MGPSSHPSPVRTRQRDYLPRMTKQRPIRYEDDADWEPVVHHPPPRRAAPKRRDRDRLEGEGEAKRRYLPQPTLQPNPQPIAPETETENIEVDVHLKRAGDGLLEDGPTVRKKPCEEPSLCSPQRLCVILSKDNVIRKEPCVRPSLCSTQRLRAMVAEDYGRRNRHRRI